MVVVGSNEVGVIVGCVGGNAAAWGIDPPTAAVVVDVHHVAVHLVAIEEMLFGTICTVANQLSEVVECFVGKVVVVLVEVVYDKVVLVRIIIIVVALFFDYFIRENL